MPIATATKPTMTKPATLCAKCKNADEAWAFCERFEPNTALRDGWFVVLKCSGFTKQEQPAEQAV